MVKQVKKIIKGSWKPADYECDNYQHTWKSSLPYLNILHAMLLFPPIFVIVTVEGDYSSPLFSNGGENCCIDNTDDHNRNYDKDTQKNVRIGPVPLFHYMRRLIVGPNVSHGGETERANPNRGQNVPNFLSRHLGLVFEWLKYSQLSVIRDRKKIKRGA